MPGLQGDGDYACPTAAGHDGSTEAQLTQHFNQSARDPGTEDPVEAHCYLTNNNKHLSFECAMEDFGPRLLFMAAATLRNDGVVIDTGELVDSTHSLEMSLLVIVEDGCGWFSWQHQIHFQHHLQTFCVLKCRRSWKYIYISEKKTNIDTDRYKY